MHDAEASTAHEAASSGSHCPGRTRLRDHLALWSDDGDRLVHCGGGGLFKGLRRVCLQFNGLSCLALAWPEGNFSLGTCCGVISAFPSFIQEDSQPMSSCPAQNPWKVQVPRKGAADTEPSSTSKTFTLALTTHCKVLG